MWSIVARRFRFRARTWSADRTFRLSPPFTEPAEAWRPRHDDCPGKCAGDAAKVCDGNRSVGRRRSPTQGRRRLRISDGCLGNGERGQTRALAGALFSNQRERVRVQSHARIACGRWPRLIPRIETCFARLARAPKETGAAVMRFSHAGVPTCALGTVSSVGYSGISTSNESRPIYLKHENHQDRYPRQR